MIRPLAGEVVPQGGLFPEPSKKEAKGNSRAWLQPVLTYIGETKLQGGKEAEKESKEMKLDQLLVPRLEKLSLEGTKGKNVGNLWLSLK